MSLGVTGESYDEINPYGENSFKATSGGCRLDARLRNFGFSIHSRPTGKDPVWMRSGQKYTQRQALDKLEELIVEKNKKDKQG